MKRKIAILLSASLLASAMPLTALAASSNSVSDTVVIKAGSTVDGASLIIKPTSSYASGASFYISISSGNAGFSSDAIETFNSEKNWAGATFETIVGGAVSSGKTELEYYAETYSSATGFTARIPYKLEYVTSTEVKVTLLGFDTDWLNSSKTEGGALQYFTTTPYVEIDFTDILVASSSGTGTISLTVDGNGTGITSGTYTLGTIYSSSGSTTTTVADEVTFDGEATLETITVKEDVAGTFDEIAGSTVTLRLNSGFKFSSSSLTVTGVRNATGDAVSVTGTFSNSGRTLTFTFPDSITFDSSLVSSFTITGLTVEPVSEDKNYGEVTLTISGDKLTSQTITVANRESIGFYLTVNEEPTTIISGRTYEVTPETEKEGNTTGVLSQEDFVTAEFTFGENYAEAWSKARLDFTLPEGVQISAVEFTGASGITSISEGEVIDYDSNYTDSTSTVSIINDGRTLRFSKDFYSNLDESTTSAFTAKLYLSVVAGYEGDITLSAVGAGLSEGDVEDIVIATVVNPFTVETTSTNLNIGYTSYQTGDITLVENVAGAFIEGGKIVIALDSTFSSEIAFSSADVTVDSDELEISKVSVSSGAIVLTVGASSYDEPASITISNIQIGTTRSIPYGSYDLSIYGDAVLNNYSSEYYATASSSNYVQNSFNNEISSYTIEGYVNVITATGTLDNVVKVTIGESTVLINDVAVDVEVAPYIQASSSSTLVPLRFVTVALGLDDIENADASSKISFDANTKTATIYFGDASSYRIIQFQAGSNVMTIDGTQINMENGVVAEITEGRMFVPFRALGQALGVSVSWDEETRTATYNAN